MPRCTLITTVRFFCAATPIVAIEEDDVVAYLQKRD